MSATDRVGSHRDLSVLIIGGIYGSPDLSRRETPETTLEKGLASRGAHVVTRPHDWHVGRRRWDIVHVHHLAHQALVQSLLREASRMVFTRHLIEPLANARNAVLNLAYRRADAVVVLSNAERGLIGTRVPDDRVACIPNGVDDQLWPFVERAAPAGADEWRILFVGQLLPIKNVDVLLRAFADLSSRINASLELVFHNDSQGSELRRLSATLGIGNRVNFVGQLDQAELCARYAKAHLLVLPSRTEALPSVITEASLTGLPVIASGVGGIPEQLDGKGALVPPGNVGALSDAITMTTRNYDLALLRAAQAARQARNLYTVDAMVNAHLALYEHVLGRPRRSLTVR